MSNESFKAFLAKVDADAGLREKLRAAGGDAGLSAQAVADFAAGQGYSFSVADLSGELSEKQLEGVAGGLSLSLSPSTTSYDWRKLTGTSSYSLTGSDFTFKFYY